MQKQGAFRPGIYCNKCGEEGHTPKDCPHPEIPLSDWYCRKAIVALKASEAVRQAKAELQANQHQETDSESETEPERERATPKASKKSKKKRRPVGGGHF